MGDFESSLLALGQGIRALRRQRGLRLVDVAAMAGIPRLKVGQVEAGRPSVAISSYARVAAVLGGQLQIVPAQRPTLDEIAKLLGDDLG